MSIVDCQQSTTDVDSECQSLGKLGRSGRSEPDRLPVRIRLYQANRSGDRAVAIAADQFAAATCMRAGGNPCSIWARSSSTMSPMRRMPAGCRPPGGREKTNPSIARNGDRPSWAPPARHRRQPEAAVAEAGQQRVEVHHSRPADQDEPCAGSQVASSRAPRRCSLWAVTVARTKRNWLVPEGAPGGSQTCLTEDRVGQPGVVHPDVRRRAAAAGAAPAQVAVTEQPDPRAVQQHRLLVAGGQHSARCRRGRRGPLG